jgi:hypothetical protein
VCKCIPPTTAHPVELSCITIDLTSTSVAAVASGRTTTDKSYHTPARSEVEHPAAAPAMAVAFPVLHGKLNPMFALKVVVQRPQSPCDPWVMLAHDRVSGSLHEVRVCLVKGRAGAIEAAEARLAAIAKAAVAEPAHLGAVDDAFVVAFGTSNTQGTAVLITPAALETGDALLSSVAGRLPPGPAYREFEGVAAAVIEGLTALHRAGIVHGNVVPSSVRRGTGGAWQLGGYMVSSLPQGATVSADFKQCEEVLLHIASCPLFACVTSRCVALLLDRLALARRRGGRQPATSDNSPKAPARALGVLTTNAQSPPRKGLAPVLISADEENASCKSVMAEADKSQAPSDIPVPVNLSTHSLAETEKHDGIITAAATAVLHESPSLVQSGSTAVDGGDTIPGRTTEIDSEPLPATPERVVSALPERADELADLPPLASVPASCEEATESPSPWSPERSASPDSATKRLQILIASLHERPSLVCPRLAPCDPMTPPREYNAPLNSTCAELSVQRLQSASMTPWSSPRHPYDGPQAAFDARCEPASPPCWFKAPLNSTCAELSVQRLRSTSVSPWSSPRRPKAVSPLCGPGSPLFAARQKPFWAARPRESLVATLQCSWFANIHEANEHRRPDARDALTASDARLNIDLGAVERDDAADTIAPVHLPLSEPVTSKAMAARANAMCCIVA